ncbi:MAG: LLM class flavin-dependent oxidoreductase [Lacunisphaera sp.]
MVPFSVLDLSNIVQGGTVADALNRSRELARHAEQLGYRRFWLAEHHNMPGIASAATAVALAPRRGRHEHDPPRLRRREGKSERKKRKTEIHGEKKRGG